MTQHEFSSITRPEETTTSSTTSLVFSEDEEEDFLDEKNLQFLLSLTPTLCYLLVLMTAGLVGNTIVFLVYYSRFKPSATRTFILAMSVCDLLTNALSLPADVVEVSFHNTFRYGWACKTTRTVKSFLGFLSACLLVAVAVDRCSKICSTAPRPTSPRRLRLIFLLSALCALAVTLPYTALTGRQTVRYPDTNVTGIKCSVQDEYVKSLFLLVYNVATGLAFLVCVAVMVVSYVRIARQLWRHKRRTTVTGKALGRSDSDAVSAGGKSRSAQRGGAGGGFQTYTDEETSAMDCRMRDSVEAGFRSETVEMSRAGAGTGKNGSGVKKAFRGERPVSALQLGLRRLGLGWGGKKTSQYCVTIAAEAVDTSECAAREDSLTPVQPTSSLQQDATDSRQGQPSTSRIALNSLAPTTTGLKAETSTDSKSKRAEPLSTETGSCLQPGTQNGQTSSVEKKSSRSRKKSPRGGSVRKIPTRTTFMMFVLTAVFIVNYLPYLVIVSLRVKMEMELLVEVLGLNVYHMAIRSYFINSAANPLVYSFCSARFRTEFQRLFGCKAN